MFKSPFNASWSYRSFINDPDLALEFNDLRFGAGTLLIETPEMNTVTGSLGGGGWSLAVTGRASYGTPYEIRFRGTGDIGDEEWVYDYRGYLVPNWTNGISQREAIVGSVIRRGSKHEAVTSRHM